MSYITQAGSKYIRPLTNSITAFSTDSSTNNSCTWATATGLQYDLNYVSGQARANYPGVFGFESQSPSASSELRLGCNVSLYSPLL